MSSPLDHDSESIDVDYYLTHHVPLFEELRWQIQDAEDWVRRFLENQNLPVPELLHDALEFASHYSSNEPPAWTEKLDSRLKNNLETSQDFRRRKAYWHVNRVEELEKNLVVLRTWMIANCSTPITLPKSLQLGLDREKNLHAVYLAKSTPATRP